MAYSGHAEQAFHRALLSAFPTRQQLEQFTTFYLGVSLGTVARSGNLSDEVFDLVRWADRNDRLVVLIKSAAEAVPDNPNVREAIRQIEDPELVETRWYARAVPLATWLFGVLDFGLLLIVVRMYLAEPVQLARPAWSLALVMVLGYFSSRLYRQLTGGPVRTDPLIWRFRRLIAHSRLSSRDWRGFAGMVAGALALAAAIELAAPPISVAFRGNALATSALPAGFRLKAFPAESLWRLQCAEATNDVDNFKCGYYVVNVCVGAWNTVDPIVIQIELATPGVSFLRMILDKPFQNRGSDSQRRGEGTISFHARSADVRRLTGCYAIPFTLQHQVDGFQPNEVRIHASILRRELAPQTDAEELASDEQVFRFSDWPSPSP